MTAKSTYYIVSEKKMKVFLAVVDAVVALVVGGIYLSAFVVVTFFVVRPNWGMHTDLKRITLICMYARCGNQTDQFYSIHAHTLPSVTKFKIF